jgi:LPS O-antigen subunit length determinant protein (WzzB/FepE family)
LGDIADQNLVDVKPSTAFLRVVNQIVSPDLQINAFRESQLFEVLGDENEATLEQKFSGVRNQLSVTRIRHDYYELGKDEKSPMQELTVSIESDEPEGAVDFLQRLVAMSADSAIDLFTSDVRTVKENRVQEVKGQLNILASAVENNRLAEIRRLEAANQESIVKLQQQVDLQVSKAKKDRLNQIIRLQEAITTANALNLVDPVTWDDLRPSRDTSQITNELAGTDDRLPLYFQGTRILNAELARLESRKDDKPFIGELSKLEKQISELENDPKIAALKARQDDSIYIEKYNQLQTELADLLSQPIEFSGAQMAVVTQGAFVPGQSTRNPVLYLAVGILLSFFIGLIVALALLSMKPDHSEQIPQ